MNDKVKGIATPVVTILIMIVVAIGAALLVSSTSNDGWAALGAIMMVFMFTGLIIIIEFIIGVVLFSRNHSDYGLGIIYGFVGIIVSGILFRVIAAIYNSVI